MLLNIRKISALNKKTNKPNFNKLLMRSERGHVVVDVTQAGWTLPSLLLPMHQCRRPIKFSYLLSFALHINSHDQY